MDRCRCVCPAERQTPEKRAASAFSPCTPDARCNRPARWRPRFGVPSPMARQGRVIGCHCRLTSPLSWASTRTLCCGRCACFATRARSSSAAVVASPSLIRRDTATSCNRSGLCSNSPAVTGTAAKRSSDGLLSRRPVRLRPTVVPATATATTTAITIRRCRRRRYVSLKRSSTAMATAVLGRVRCSVMSTSESSTQTRSRSQRLQPYQLYSRRRTMRFDPPHDYKRAATFSSLPRPPALVLLPCSWLDCSEPVWSRLRRAAEPNSTPYSEPAFLSMPD